MTRTDTTVVGALVVLLALIAGLVGIPALTATTATPSPTGPSYASARAYREGVVGHPASVSPLTARTQADRDLVALVFSGLVRNGPNGTIVPDLAASWTVDPTGKTWTFDLRPDARWHDGEPVTADDVVYTIQTLQDPAYKGPASTSWSEVSVEALSPLEVTFTLTTPLGGFLQAATQPIAPAHLLGQVPVDLLPDHPFGRQPVGSGPFALVSLDDTHAELAPAEAVQPAAEATADPSALATDSLTTAAPTGRPERPTPYLAGIDLSFYDNADQLVAAYRKGDLDAAAGLPPATAADLATMPDSRLLRYPSSTLTAVLLNLRPTHPEFRDPAVRTALLGAIDRAKIVDSVYANAAVVAPDPVPPTSVLFDPAADPVVAFSRAESKKALKAAGWVAEGRRLAPARREGAAGHRGREPGPGLQSGRVRRRGRRGQGLDGDRPRRHPRGAAPGGVRDGAALERDLHGGRHGRHHRPRPGPLPAAGVEPDADRRLERGGRPGSGARQAPRGGPGAGLAGRPRGGVFGPGEGALDRQIPAPDRLRGRDRRGPGHGPGTRSAAGLRPG